MQVKLTEAFLDQSFPGNPLPFLNGIAEHVRENGTDSIQSDEVKKVLWVVMAQAYGQCATIDLMDEWSRLEKGE